MNNKFSDTDTDTDTNHRKKTLKLEIQQIHLRDRERERQRERETERRPWRGAGSVRSQSRRKEEEGWAYLDCSSRCLRSPRLPCSPRKLPRPQKLEQKNQRGRKSGRVKRWCRKAEGVSLRWVAVAATRRWIKRGNSSASPRENLRPSSKHTGQWWGLS